MTLLLLPSSKKEQQKLLRREKDSIPACCWARKKSRYFRTCRRFSVPTEPLLKDPFIRATVSWEKKYKEWSRLVESNRNGGVIGFPDTRSWRRPTTYAFFRPFALWWMTFPDLLQWPFSYSDHLHAPRTSGLLLGTSGRLLKQTARALSLFSLFWRS